ncbi:MAG: type II toxin-antitoxin system HipA family toxin YjjJ [Gammaproteobacteria bacterium]
MRATVKVADSVARLLSTHGASSSATLQSALGVTQPALARAIASLDDRVMRIGAGRHARYGLRRELPRIGSSWPVCRVNADGEPTRLGQLNALARDQYWFNSECAEHSRLSDGLPFFLQDLVPQGFVGRSIPGRVPELGLPESIADWSDDHVLTYLCLRGEDCIGDLILGEESLRRFLTQSAARATPIESEMRTNEYYALAEAAMTGVTSGSLAGGEHPKFTASVRQGNSLRHVMVKFSPKGNDRVARRWADLLVCEHVATRALHRAGLTCTVTELVREGDRLFLEADRFDRAGVDGRTGLVSLAALANEHLGRWETWTTATASLAKLGVVTPADAETVRRLATFGRLIANTDMHFGNLSFRLSFEEPLTLAPVYDMLPMFYAPLAGGALPNNEFEPRPPGKESIDIWNPMVALAARYWREVAGHSAISAEFAVRAARIADLVAATKTSR